MAIRASASLEVRRLLGDLEGDDPVRRVAAVARLAVIGTRAVRQILEHLAAADQAAVKAPLLLALESIPDPRAVEPVLAALSSDDSDVRVAAIRAGRGLLTLPEGTRVLDRLTALVLNPGRPGAERAVALEALSLLPARTVRPLIEKLRDDPSREVRDVITQAGVPVDDPVAELEEAADGWLARDPDAVVHLVSRASGDAPLSTLHRLIEKVRSKESEGRLARRRDWGAVRGALHVALARRASKVALYDLREAFERTRDPLPPDYVTAMGLIGDGSCLEPLAVAFVQTHAMEDADLWRRDVTAVFRQIVDREKLTRRHGPIRRVRARFRNEVDELLR